MPKPAFQAYDEGSIPFTRSIPQPLANPRSFFDAAFDRWGSIPFTRSSQFSANPRKFICGPERPAGFDSLA